MADRSVVVRLRADIQQYQASMRQASQATKDFGNEVTGRGGKAKADIEGIGRAALLGGAAIAAGFGVAAVTAANFEKEMSGVRAVSGATSDEMRSLSDAALAAGASTKLAGVTASDAARAEAELVKAGVSVSDVLGGALMGSLTLAAAGQIDFANAATIAAQAMNIFDLRGSDVTHVADVLASAANKSAADVGGLGDALRQGGLVASQYGLSLEDTVGVMAAFADNALVGSDAGTALKTMLQRLSPISKESAQLMEELGFSAYDLQGNFIGIDGVARELQESLQGMTQAQRDTTMAQLFGSDAVRGANILYEEGAAGIREYIEAVDDQGAAARMAAIQNDNLKGDVEALGGALESAFIKTGSQATGALRGLVQTTTDAVTGFSAMPGPLQTVVVGLGAITGAASLGLGMFIQFGPQIIKATDALKGMDSSIGKFAGNNMGKLAGGLAGIGAAVTIGAIAYEKATRSSREYEQTVGELAGALAPVLEGQKSLNDALSDFLELQSGGMSTEAIAGMNALGVTLDDVERAIIDGKDALEPFREAVAALGIDMEGVDFGKLGDKGTLSEPFERLANELGISKDALEELSNTAEDWDGHAQDAAKRSIDLAVANEQLTQSQVDAALEMFTLKDGTVNYAGALDSLIPKVKGTGDAAEGTAGAMVTLADGTSLSAEEAKEAESAFKSLIDAYRGAVDPLFGMLDAVDANREAQSALTEALALNSDGIADNEKSAAELDAMFRAVASSAMDVEVAARELSNAIATGNVDLATANSMLAEWVANGSMTEEQARQVAAQFASAADQGARIAPEYRTVVTADTATAEARLAAFRRMIDSTPKTVQVTFNGVVGSRPNVDYRAGATGGLVPDGLRTVYRAAGGPSGTDTVNAWLTPGEYVMQKSAVDRFGVGFMESLNAGMMAMPTMAVGGGSIQVVLHGSATRADGQALIDALDVWRQSNGPLPARLLAG